MFVFALPAELLLISLIGGVFSLPCRLRPPFYVTALGFLVHADGATPDVLLVFVVLAGTASALIMPASGVVPSSCPARLQAAVALNSVGLNISRAMALPSRVW